MNRNEQNKKIKYLENKRLHAAGRSKTNRKLNLFRQKTEKWLDNRGFGVYTALITRIRELVWIVIGVMLMKIGNGKNI